MNFDDLLSSIDSEITRLKQARALLAGTHGGKSAGSSPIKRKRTMSAAARKRIGDAQRKRWAAVRNAAKPTPAKAGKKAAAASNKRKMSAAAKKRIAAAQRKRWAAIRAAKEAAKKVPAKKVAKKAKVKKAAAAKKAAPKKAAAGKAKKAAPEKTTAATAEAAKS